MIVLLALLAAFVYGSGVVLQQRAALQAPAELAARPSLLIRLFRHPLWLLGLAADVAGFGLQALALHKGSLTIVQPLITTSLLFTLALTALWTHRTLPAGEWVAVILVLAGLAVFLIVASPNEQSVAAASSRGWLLCTTAVCAVAIIAVGAGLRFSGAVRAGLFGVAAGIADAYMAVLAKAFAGSFGHGLVGVFWTWTPYALVAGGLTAMLLVSTAYQAGHPTVSLPIITVVDPLVGSLVGITLFGERLMIGGGRGPLIALSLLVMVIGIFVLCRDSELASNVAGEAPTPRPAAVEPR
jgi:drug/metabolite transporter (DMT)-like permease